MTGRANQPSGGGYSTISLEEQVRRYEENWADGVLRLERDLCSPAYLAHIHDLGLARLREGFVTYGDEAYHWGAACRAANADEEIADYIVYSTTGEM